MKTDLIIIGAGPGGYHTAAYATRNGLEVTIIEKGHVGGTCLNCGCIPTKSLCHDAEMIDSAAKAKCGLDMQASNISNDFAGIIARKDEVVSKLRTDVEMLLSQHGITLVRGDATLVDANTVCVEGQTFTADKIIIATGSRPKILQIEGAGLPGVVTSDDLLSAETMPHNLCIIGAGVIGLEFASIFRSFGCEVTVLEYLKECLPQYDDDISRRVRKALEKRGINFTMQAAVSAISNEDGHLSVEYSRKGKTASVAADTVLMATGRIPNTDGLGIETVGIETRNGCIIVDDNMQTKVNGIYAIGDVNGRCMLAHAAMMQGMRCVNHILGRTDNIRLDIMPSAVFTVPEAAAVGLTENYCRESGIDCRVIKTPFRANGRALAEEAEGGLLKLIVSTADDKIIGCHVCGRSAAAIVQEAAAIMSLGCTAERLHEIVHIHPTIAELLTSC